MTPRVSVITIFLNEERFLSEALESVLTQTMEDWELLVVDDGSSDGSSEIARSYARADRRIAYLEHPGRENRGMSASRNLGLARARGEVVALLDADDVWFSDTLDRQLAILESQPIAAMVCGTAEWWHSWAGAQTSGGDSWDVVAVRAGYRSSPLPPPRFATTVIADGAAVPCPSTVAVRTDVLRRLGGFEDAFRGLYEDQVLYVKVGLDYPVAVTRECLGHYRQHDRQACVVAGREGTAAAARERFLQWTRDYARGRGEAGRKLNEVVGALLPTGEQ